MPVNYPKLLLCLGICLGVGFLGSFLTISEIPTWYASLNKPVFSPPNWIFGPVWTTLYFMMGVAVYFVISAKGKVKSQKAVQLFGIQLILNVLWSYLFFGLHNPLLALVDIVALWIFIYLTIQEFRRISVLAAILLAPYLLWVSFASILNLAIVLLNS